jgi:hypothetical protein
MKGDKVPESGPNPRQYAPMEEREILTINSPIGNILRKELLQIAPSHKNFGATC